MNVVNIRDKSTRCTLYIGRFCSKGAWSLPGSKWRNNFIISQRNSRESCISNYEKQLLTGGLYRDLYQLLGQTLGCWCKPESCHGDVLVRYCNAVTYDVLIENKVYKCNLSQLSGIRTAELYLSFIGRNCNILGNLPYPRIEKYNKVSVNGLDIINFPDISDTTLYLVMETNATYNIQILTNDLADYLGGFLCCLSIYDVEAPRLWKHVYNTHPYVQGCQLLSSQRIH